MAISLTQGASIAADTTFRARVAMAFYYVARAVVTENSSTPGHENRVRFAKAIVFQPYEAYLQFAAIVVTDKAIVDASPANASAVTDAQIVAAVTGMWNTLANVEG